MSCDWRIWCLDCEAEHYFGDANHQRDMMRAIIAAAPALLALHHAGFSEFCVRVETSYGPVDLEWFARHEGHRLVPRSEYGEVDGDCATRVPCVGCGVHFWCALPRGHEGEHSPKRGSL